jgi:hypothetical protein
MRLICPHLDHTPRVCCRVTRLARPRCVFAQGLCLPAAADGFLAGHGRVDAQLRLPPALPQGAGAFTVCCAGTEQRAAPAPSAVQGV